MQSYPVKELKERSTATRHLRVSDIFDGTAHVNPEGTLGHAEQDKLFYDLLLEELLSIAATRRKTVCCM